MKNLIKKAYYLELRTMQPAKKTNKTVSYQLKIYFRHRHTYKCFGVMLNSPKYNINHIPSLYKP